MNINSNATSAIVDSVFTLGLFGMDRRCAEHSVRGIGVLRERLDSRRLFMLLDRSRCALVCCVPIDRSICLRGADALRTSLLCLALLRPR